MPAIVTCCWCSSIPGVLKSTSSKLLAAAIRLSPDKKIGTVVVPVFIDTSEDLS